MNDSHHWYSRLVHEWPKSKLGNSFSGALLVASIIVVLHSAGFLERINVITLNATMSYKSLTDIVDPRAPENISKFKDPSRCVEGNTCEKDAEGRDRKTYLLTINQYAFEKTFNQSSPLDRKVLAGLLDKIELTHPSVLAIDLDLSPNPFFDDLQATNGEKCGDKCKDEILLRSLKQLARSGTEVLLLMPEPVITPAAIAAKVKWMMDLMESKNIYFAWGSIPSMDGMSLKYIDNMATIPKGIFTLVHKPQSPVLISDHFLTEIEMALPKIFDMEPCPSLLEQRLGLLLNRTVRDLIAKEPIPRDNLKPYNLNFDFVPNEQYISLGDAHKSFNQTLEELSALPKNQVFIIGGDYGVGDYYVTPIGNQSGVKLHFATYYSMMDQIQQGSHILSFVIEVIIGTGLSLILGLKLVPSLIAGGILGRFIVIGFLSAVMLILCFLSYLFLVKFNFWLNPAPLVVGISLHKFFHFVVEGEPEQGQGLEKIHLSFIKAKYSQLNHILEKFLKLGIVFVALILLILH